MAIDRATGTVASVARATIAALVADDGSGAHPSVAPLSAPRAPLRDMADSLHCLCMLHGRVPGAIDIVADRSTHPVARTWLVEAAIGFGEERGLLSRLVSAAGPLPSTPGQAVSEAAILTQRHALDMLARSDRAGCATGAAIGIVLDWFAIRRVLDRAAERLGVALPAPTLPDPDATMALIDATAFVPAYDRAMAFGAQQALAQHRGLWNLIDARASARAAG